MISGSVRGAAKPITIVVAKACPTVGSAPADLMMSRAAPLAPLTHRTNTRLQFTGLAHLTPNSSSGWYHLLEDASGVTASGTPVVVFDSITPYFAPPTG